MGQQSWLLNLLTDQGPNLLMQGAVWLTRECGASARRTLSRTVVRTDESTEKSPRLQVSSGRVSVASAFEETQSLTEADQPRALTGRQETESVRVAKFLMERVVERSNLNRAYRKVRSNKGSAGVDGRLQVSQPLQRRAWDLCHRLRQQFPPACR